MRVIPLLGWHVERKHSQCEKHSCVVDLVILFCRCLATILWSIKYFMDYISGSVRGTTGKMPRSVFRGSGAQVTIYSMSGDKLFNFIQLGSKLRPRIE